MDIQYVLPIARLAVIANSFQNMPLCVEPEKFQLSVYEQDVMPAMIASLVDGLGIEKAKPRFRLGRVFSFDVTPVRVIDPVIVVCPLMDLSEYYHSWMLLMRCDRYRIRDLMVDYDAGIKRAIRSARALNEDEIRFAICEMLHFRNTLMGRAAWSS